MSSTSQTGTHCQDQAPAGKPRNAAATRNAILKAASTHFLKDGYDNAGLRAIAAEAGIDPALICRYFGSKNKLFAEVLESTTSDPMSMFAGERAGFGKRVAEAMLNPSEHVPSRMTFIGLITSSSASVEASKLVHQHIEKQFMIPFSAWLGCKAAMEKAWLIASVLIGVIIMNNLKPDQNISCERFASMLQAIIDAA